MGAESSRHADDRADCREFEVDGAVWLAEVTGACMVGGLLGPAALDSVHLRCRDYPARAVRLGYVPRGALGRMRDEELQRLQGSAQALAPRPEPADRSRARRVDGTR